MTGPAVSVCIPTYNYVDVVVRAVESVLAQTFEDFELLIYDDASTDNTVEVLQPFLDDPRVTLVVQDQNQGLFANFDQSAERARGRYIKYLCADDWLDPRFLELTVPVLDAHPEIQLLTTANWDVDWDGALVAKHVAPFGDGPVVVAEHAAKQLALWGNVVGMPTNTLIRRAALEAVEGFDAHYAPGADVHLWLKLLAGSDMGWISQPLCYWRIHRQHTHDYGPDPSESMFLVWRDAPQIGSSPASPKTAQIGLDREAIHCAVHASAHVLRGNIGAARRLMTMATKHVSRMRVLGLMLISGPRLVVDHARRILAIRRDRLVVYSPRPRIGPPLSSVETTAADGQPISQRRRVG